MLRRLDAADLATSVASIIYTVSQKNIPDIFHCNLKTNYQIKIIFGMIILDTTCHQTSLVSHLTQYMFLHYLGKSDQAKYVLK